MYFYVVSGIVILIVLSTANLINYVCIKKALIIAYKQVFFTTYNLCELTTLTQHKRF